MLANEERPQRKPSVPLQTSYKSAAKFEPRPYIKLEEQAELLFVRKNRRLDPSILINTFGYRLLHHDRLITNDDVTELIDNLDTTDTSQIKVLFTIIITGLIRHASAINQWSLDFGVAYLRLLFVVKRGLNPSCNAVISEIAGVITKTPQNSSSGVKPGSFFAMLTVKLSLIRKDVRCVSILTVEPFNKLPVFSSPRMDIIAVPFHSQVRVYHGKQFGLRKEAEGWFVHAFYMERIGLIGTADEEVGEQFGPAMARWVDFSGELSDIEPAGEEIIDGGKADATREFDLLVKTV